MHPRRCLSRPIFHVTNSGLRGEGEEVDTHTLTHTPQKGIHARAHTHTHGPTVTNTPPIPYPTGIDPQE